MPGYSSAPLARKLGFKPATTVVTVDAPPEYVSWLDDLPEGVNFTRTLKGRIKVCAINDVWSGLKLVIRKTERGER
jgi:hypothetical protein